MFVVYTTRSSIESGAELQAIELSNNISAFEIDSLLNGRNWYASVAHTAEDAIDEARAANCQLSPVTRPSRIPKGFITLVQKYKEIVSYCEKHCSTVT